MLQRMHRDDPAHDAPTAQEILRILADGASCQVGEAYFRTLVRGLARALGAAGAWITEYRPEERSLRTLALWVGGKHVTRYAYAVAGTPCAAVIDERRRVHVSEAVTALYPGDAALARFRAEGYLGAPILEADGACLGHLAVMDTRPLPPDPDLLGIFALFTDRAIREYRRWRAERRTQCLVDEIEHLREASDLVDDADGPWGESDATRRLREAIHHAASRDEAALVVGEPGSGKGWTARAIHRASARAERPFVCARSAARSTAEIEVDWFGAAGGSAAGGELTREGRFARADGGTAFVDRVDELPASLQQKLLRVIEQREIVPAGDTRARKVDVRVIASTRADPAVSVSEGRLGADLLRALSSSVVHVPPLRVRGDDASLLAERFAGQMAARQGRRIDPLDEPARARIRGHDWPGNVRELRNAVERALLLSSGSRLEIERVLTGEADPEIDLPVAPGVDAGPGVSRVLTAEEVRRLERENLRRAMEACGWKVAGRSGAARLLGLPPSTLASRLQVLGLRRPRS